MSDLETIDSDRPWMESSGWLLWLSDVAAMAERLVQEESVRAEKENELELISVKTALYARALSFLKGAILLIRNDLHLDFRAHVRAVIEVAIYMVALDRDPRLLGKMKDGNLKSFKSRARLRLNSKRKMPDEARKLLEEFIAQGSTKLESVNVGEIAEDTAFQRLYHSYRDISADAAHVSISSLERHTPDSLEEGMFVLVVQPEFDDIDLYLTAVELGMAMMAATLNLMKVKKKTQVFDEFLELGKGLSAMSKNTRPAAIAA